MKDSDKDSDYETFLASLAAAAALTGKKEIDSLNAAMNEQPIDVQKIKKLISDVVKYKSYNDPQKMSLFMNKAIELGNIEIIKELIHAVPVVVKNNIISSAYVPYKIPLEVALEKGETEIAKLLINEGANVTFKNCGFLHQAIMNKNNEIAELLIGKVIERAKENLNSTPVLNYITMKTPLGLALETKNMKICENLIKAGANPTLLAPQETKLLLANFVNDKNMEAVIKIIQSFPEAKRMDLAKDVIKVLGADAHKELGKLLIASFSDERQKELKAFSAALLVGQELNGVKQQDSAGSDSRVLAHKSESIERS